MALTLHLLRHAKSSWKDPGQADHDRPLNGRGRRAADAMGAFLAREGPPPTHVLCSSSARTRETWDRLRKFLDGEPDATFEPDLYLASAAGMLELLRSRGGEAPCVLLIGHNPGTAELALKLAGSGDEDGWHRMRAKFPTGALATLAFEVASWSALAPATGVLRRFTTPRQLT